MDKDIALDNLIAAKSILDGLKVKFFLSNGTLLGYYREKDFISHDIDIDLGVMIRDFDDRILSLFVNNGFKIYKIYGDIETGIQYSFIRNNIKLDIFFYYAEDNKLWHVIYNGDERARYVYPMTKFYKGVFNGMNILVPSKSFLVAEYGEEWTTPVKEWHWWTSPHNIEYE